MRIWLQYRIPSVLDVYLSLSTGCRSLERSCAFRHFLLTRLLLSRFMSVSLACACPFLDVMCVVKRRLEKGRSFHIICRGRRRQSLMTPEVIATKRPTVKTSMDSPSENGAQTYESHRPQDPERNPLSKFAPRIDCVSAILDVTSVATNETSV